MKIVQYGNSLIKNTLLFFIAFVWINFYVASVVLTILLSVAAVFAFNFISNKTNGRKKNKVMLKKQQHEEIENMAIQFAFMEKYELLRFFAKALSNDVDCKIIDKSYIELQNPKKTLVFYETNVADISTMCAKAFKNESKKVVILCNTKQKSVKLISNLEIMILEKAAVYLQICKKYSTLPPQIAQITKPQKFDIKTLGKIAIAPEKTKSYVFIGILLIFTGLVIRFSLYYVIMSSLLFGLAFFSYSYGKILQLPKQNIVDL